MIETKMIKVEAQKKRIVVIIPIYKEQPSPEEQDAIRNNVAKLDQYDVCFVGPKGLNLNAYYKLCKKNIAFISFKKEFFKGISGYNRLLLSCDFYIKFSNYDYLYICQPDVWIIRDGNCLDSFIEDGYDYIGAPWIDAQYLRLIPTTNKFRSIVKVINKCFPEYELFVGNGGFSLRKIGSCIRVIRDYRKIWFHNEDIFFSYIGTYIDKEFKLPSVETAMRFSLEQCSKEICESKGIIPVGVHKYSIYYPDIKKQNVLNMPMLY